MGKRVAIMFLIGILLSVSVLGDSGQVWEDFSTTVDFDGLVDTYNWHVPSLPESLLSALKNEHVIVYFYADRSGVVGRGTRDIVAVRSLVFEESEIIEHSDSALEDPTLFVYISEEAFYGLMNGEQGLLHYLDEGSMGYHARGFFKSVKLWWLKRGYTPGSTSIVLYQQKTPADETITDIPQGKQVEFCGSSGSANVFLSQMVSIRNCTGCPVEHMRDICKDKYTLVQVGCDGNNFVCEEVSCLDLGRICFEGACVRDTSKTTSVSGLSSTERFLSLSTQELDCYESDNGNKPAERGITVFNDERFEDFCISPEEVLEFWCEGGEMQRKEVSCTGEDMCFHGACRADITGAIASAELDWTSSLSLCAETDSGDDLVVAGTVTVKACPTCKSLDHSDGCVTSGIVNEQYCSGRFRREREVSCFDSGGYCSRGACTDSPARDTSSLLSKEDDLPYAIEFKLNKSRTPCYKHRKQYSVVPGDEQELTFYTPCETCNYTYFTEDCYMDNVYEFTCINDFPTALSQPCLQGVCYQGRCVLQSNLTDVQIDVEENRQSAVNNMSLCHDSDDGRSASTFGLVEIRTCPFCPPKSRNHVFFDSCTSDTQLQEQFCTGGYRNFTTMDCTAYDKVCLDGKCQ